MGAAQGEVSSKRSVVKVNNALVRSHRRQEIFTSTPFLFLPSWQRVCQHGVVSVLRPVTKCHQSRGQTVEGLNVSLHRTAKKKKKQPDAAWKNLRDDGIVAWKDSFRTGTGGRESECFVSQGRRNEEKWSEGLLFLPGSTPQRCGIAPLDINTGGQRSAGFAAFVH